MTLNKLMVSNAEVLGNVAPDRVLSMGQIELFDMKTECKLMTYATLNCLKKNCLII